MLTVVGMSCLTACTTARKASNAPICRIAFDWQDEGIDTLNLQNLRALASFKDICYEQRRNKTKN